MQVKVLFLSHDNDLKGAERCLLELVTHLDLNRFKPLIVLPWRGPMEEKLKQENVYYMVRFLDRWIPSRHRASWNHPFKYLPGLRNRLWSLLSLIEREKIDLVYTNTSTILEGALAARRAGIPHVWHIHEHLRGNADLRCYFPTTWIDRITLSLSDRIITPSKALADNRFHGSEKVRTVSNGVNLAAFRSGDGKRVYMELGIPQNASLVTFVGGISKRKSPIDFARAAVMIHRQRPDVHFLLAGSTNDPVLEKNIRDLLKQARLNDCFHILGFRSDVANLLAAAKVHVSTSLQESFGLTLIEAMASYKPVVATRCGGPEEVVADEETGFIVEPKNPQAIAEAMLKLLNQPDLARRFGEAGRLRVEKEFTVETYAHQISEIIEEAIRTYERPT
ncbi:glycosyltransferase family 4 protein [Methylohalobius crimeensis]|uniref:glycosyltransferase family 4 protein n=1 Tax=Methylohalobius crimeensis TaxID=244365 RepID=UPI0003B7615B|nr:glycosyltransferase family 4 protein [Methylohalobius crimeensis]